MSFAPHGFCLGWPGPPAFPPALVVLHILGDLSGVAAYPLLALGIGWLLARSWPVLPAIWRLIAIATMAFLVACGTTHLMDILVLVWPAYWLQAWVKLAMGVSALTALLAARKQIPRVRLAQAAVYVRQVAEALRDLD